MKKRTMCIIPAIAILLIYNHNHSTTTISPNKSASPQTESSIAPQVTTSTIKISDCFSANLPDGWSVECDDDNCEAVFLHNNNKTGYLTLYSPANTTTEGLVCCIGMHAYPKDKGVDTDMGSYIMKKVTVGYELSAAQNENGEPIPDDEIHYFYYNTSRDKEMAADLYFEPKTISEEELDQIAKQIVYKP